jgi:hypothetical protein
LGQRIAIDPDMLKQVEKDLISITGDIMIETSIVHFKVPPEEAQYIPMKLAREAVPSGPAHKSCKEFLRRLSW